MLNFKQIIKSFDFSKETQLKERLRRELFTKKELEIYALPEDSLDLVSAAGEPGYVDHLELKDKLKDKNIP